MIQTAYISYSYKNKNTAFEVSNLLQRLGIKTPLLRNEDSLGIPFAEQIVARIKSCCFIILIVSKESLQSQWVRREIEFAKKEGKNIISLVTDNISENEISESWIANVIHKNITFSWSQTNESKNFNELKNAIKKFQIAHAVNKSHSNFSVEGKTYGAAPIGQWKDSENEEDIDEPNNAGLKSFSLAGFLSTHVLLCILATIVLGVLLLIFLDINKENKHFQSSTNIDDDSILVVEENIPFDTLWVIEDDYLITDSIAADSIILDSDYYEAPTYPDYIEDLNDPNNSYDPDQSPDISESTPTVSESQTTTFTPEISQGTKTNITLWLLVIVATVVFVSLGTYIVIRNRKLTIKLAANDDCEVTADNHLLATLTANRVVTVKLKRGNYFLLFKPKNESLTEQTKTINLKEPGELITVAFINHENCHRQRKVIKCFIAGSTKLQTERDTLRAAISQINNGWSSKGYEILSYTFEDFDRQVVPGGQQNNYDAFLKNDAKIAVFIISGDVGDKTVQEFNVAFSSFKDFGHPQILVFNDELAKMHPHSEELKKSIIDKNQYWVDYKSLEIMKLQFMHTLNWLIINEHV